MEVAGMYAPNSTVYQMYLRLLEEEDRSLSLRNPVHKIYIELRTLGFSKKEAESALRIVGHWAPIGQHINHILALRISIDDAVNIGNNGGNGGSNKCSTGVWNEVNNSGGGPNNGGA